MPSLTYIPALRTADNVGGGVLTAGGGRGVGGGRITPPTACKWLKIDENGARVAGDHKARLCPACGAQTCLEIFNNHDREKKV